MARAARFPCRKTGCSKLLDKSGYCADHKPKPTPSIKKQTDEAYKERNRFYQRAAWKRARLHQLQSEPMCRKCRAAGKLVAAAVVDHIKPIDLGGEQLDSSNLQSLCVVCHNKKTLADANSSGWGV